MMSNVPRDVRALSKDAGRISPTVENTGVIEAAAPWIIAATAVCFLIFIALAGLVIGDDTHDVDARILLAMRSVSDPTDPIGPKWLEGYMRDLTALGGFAVLSILVLSISGFLAATGRAVLALRIFAISLTGWLLSQGAKFAFARPRPDLVPYGAEVYASSFPSGHAMTSAVVYLTLGAALARTTSDVRVKVYVLGLAAALTLIIGVSRVYLGVHWPTDVLGGWALGAAWVGVAWAALRALDHRSNRVDRNSKD